MKTPREILLQHHQATVPKLDEIRHEVLNTEFQREGRHVAVPKFRVASIATVPRLFWRELIWPCHRTWAGLAAVWLGLLVFNLAHSERGPVATAKPTTAMLEMSVVFQEQQRLLLELVGPAPAILPAEPPRRLNLQPRSERRTVLMVA